MKKISRVLLLSLGLMTAAVSGCRADVYWPREPSPAEIMVSKTMSMAVIIGVLASVIFVAVLSCFLIAKLARKKLAKPSKMEIISEKILYVVTLVISNVVAAIIILNFFSMPQNNTLLVVFISLLILISIVIIIASIRSRKKNKKISYVVALIPVYILAIFIGWVLFETFFI